MVWELTSLGPTGYAFDKERKKKGLFNRYAARPVPGGGWACLLTGAPAHSGSLGGRPSRWSRQVQMKLGGAEFLLQCPGDPGLQGVRHISIGHGWACPTVPMSLSLGYSPDASLPVLPVSGSVCKDPLHCLGSTLPGPCRASKHWTS